MEKIAPPTATQMDWAENNEALLEFSAGGKKPLPENYWSLNDAFQGVQIFGGTGSGKSTGSGQALARAFLEANLGGLVLTAKSDEVGVWREYAERAGRSQDLIIVDETQPYRFNFLRYELKRPGLGAGHTENLVNLFCSVLEASERRNGQGGSSDSYWQRTLKQLLRNAIDLTVLAMDDLDLPSLYRVISTAPTSRDELADPQWQTDSVCLGSIQTVEAKFAEPNPDPKLSARRDDFYLCKGYWLKEFPGLANETRSAIVSIFTSMADCFMRGALRTLFCTDLNFGPEDAFEGKIIVLNLPVKEYNELGQFAQVLFKFIFQRSVERRVPSGVSRANAEKTVRPVFIWADESQFFVNSYDALFQSTARASRACTVYLTQNLPSYYAAFSGANAMHETEAFLGNLQTKIFHANGDPATNRWAAESIGRLRQMTFSTGLSESAGKNNPGGGIQQNAGSSQVLEYTVQPQEFTMLRTGGEECDFLVDSIVFQGGRRWVVSSKGETVARNFIRQSFSQVHEGRAN